jgi:N-acetylneuraminic acid mutarotase
LIEESTLEAFTGGSTPGLANGFEPMQEEAMFSHQIRPLTLALAGLTMISCTDETTAPRTAVDEVPVENSFALAANSTSLAAAASNTWIRRADMPSTERRNPATAMVRNAAGQSVLYVIGGTTTSGASLGKVQAYNVATNTWTYKAEMPTPRYSSNGTGVINGKIYISGGLTSYKGYTEALHMYDPATNRWSAKQPMPETNERGVTGVINNQMYVLTGCDQEDCSDAIIAFYRYNPATNQWAKLPAPPGSLMRSIAGTIGKKFYVTGNNGQIGVYDPVTNSWTMKTATGQVPFNATGLALSAKLYALNLDHGNPDGTVTTSIRVYDPATNAWTKRAPVTLKQIGRLALVVREGSPRIEMVGGVRPGNNLQYTP